MEDTVPGTSRSPGSNAHAVSREFDKRWHEWRKSRTRKLQDQPRLESLLDELPVTERRDVALALLKTDLNHRMALNELPTLLEYQQRLPGYAEEVRTAFDHCAPLDDYLLIARIGGGGMGDVYQAEHIRLTNVVAIKVLPQMLMNEGSALARFRQEMSLIGRLDHRNIVRARDAREVRGQHLLVMDFVEGRDLLTLVRSVGPFPYGVACELIRQAAEGLAHAHKQGLVHRDIKPSNLMLDRTGTLKVLDFGLAKLKLAEGEADAGLTKSSHLMGTLDYMAPEQFEDAAKVDIRADIYGLGCTLYHLLVGQPPFRDSSNDSALKKQAAHANAPIPWVRDARLDCPRAIDDLIGRMMAKDPEQRVSTPTELAGLLAPLASKSALSEFAQQQVTADHLSRMDASRQAAIQTHSVESTVNTPQKRVRQDDAETSERVLGVSSRRNWLIAAASLTLSIPALYFLLPSQRSKVDPAVRQEIASLPGLSGGWWFHEMPWYTPGVRLKVIEALEQGETTIGGVDLRDLKRSLMSGADIATATEQLREVAKTVTHRDLRAAERDAALRLGGTDPESIDQQSFHKGLDEIYEELASSKDRTATQWHLGAVVLQELNRWDEAETWYRGALEAYEASPDPLPELAALACSDYAQLLIDREEGDRLLAAGKLDQARGYLQPMRANCLSTWIGCQGEESQSAVHDLVAANIMAEKTWADADKTFGTGHPLATYAMERAGWSRLELFHLHEARQAFVTALELRRADKSNPRSLRYVIHDEQAIGMCDYFLGKEEAATRLKRIVEEEFPRFLSQSSSPKVRGEMVARLPNTLERLGDCYLFGEFDPREAARHYEASEAAAAQARVQTGRTSSSMVRVRYKHAISLAMSGEREAALAAAETAELADVKVGETAVSFDTEDQRVFGLCREVAEALTQTKDSAGRSLRLEEVLKGREPFLEHHGEINRDELAQLLLISRILLESGKFDETEALTDEQVTSVVDSILEMRDEIVGGGRDADAFFKPYWELAATAVEAHLKQINDEKAKRRLSGLAKDLDDCLKK